MRDTARSCAMRMTLCLMAALVLSAGGCGHSADTAAPVAKPEARTASPTVSVPALRVVAPKVSRVPRRRPTRLVGRPAIVQDPIPFPLSRKLEMALYAQRHYGIDSYRLIDPHVIVEHYTETGDLQSTYQTFAPDHPDSELHELPNTCAHFVVDRDGTIYQLVSLALMCRHTVGLNYTAIGIENVGYGAREILDDGAQLRSSLALTRWLRCRYGIALADVIGHNESLTSPYHRENVPSLRAQTHEDWRRADMDAYRALLRRLPCA